jgi:hypothetical protein
MLNFFKQDKKGQPLDVKAIREQLLQFIKEQLQKLEGGEGANIKALLLFIACSDAEKHLYESAVYLEQENRFKNEDVQKIADDFALSLPDTWAMEITFVKNLPPEAEKDTDLPVALFIQTRKRAIKKAATAYINVLNGEAEKEAYTITSTSGRINIGRERKVQTADGFYRINTIAFPAGSTHAGNKYVSRQHAHIEYEDESGVFILFADDGGVPPRNKIKVRSVGGELIKLQSTTIGHILQQGDQIILGETALLEFSYTGGEN